MSVLEHGAFVFAGLLTDVVATRAGAQRRHPSAALAWVGAIAAFPYLATPLFLLFGRRKFVRPGHRAVVVPVGHPMPAPQWATSLLAGLGLPGPVANQSVQFQPDGGDALQALLDLIGGAQRSVDVGTFLLGADAVCAHRCCWMQWAASSCRAVCGCRAIQRLLRRHGPSHCTCNVMAPCRNVPAKRRRDSRFHASGV